MRGPALALAALLLTAQPGALAAAEGKLERVSQKAQATPVPTAAPTAGPAKSEGGGGDAWTWLSWGIQAALFAYVLPGRMAGDSWEVNHPWRPGSDSVQPYSLKLGGDASYHDGVKIVSAGLEGAWKRLELRASGSRVEEWPSQGERGFAHLAKADLLMRFVNTRGLRLRSGLGGRSYFDPNRGISLGGLNFIYGVEASYGPCVARLDGELGGLGRSLVLEAKGTLGVLLGALELYGGYQNIDLGGIGLGGPLLGLRGWF